MTERLLGAGRMAYIEGSQHGACLFCGRHAEGADRTNLILHRGALAYVVMNLYPYANGHLMVVPYRHCPDLAGLTPEESLDNHDRRHSAVPLFSAGAVRAEGFNVGFNLGKAAGAGVLEHVHLHIVARAWAGHHR